MQIDVVITLIIAILGLILSIVNTWYLFHRDRIRLKLQNSHYLSLDYKIGVTATNFSTVPLVIFEAGYWLPGDKKLIQPYAVTVDGKSLPVKLEPGESAMIITEIHSQFTKEYKSAVGCYVRTSYDKIFKGDVKALKGYLAELSKTTS